MADGTGSRRAAIAVASVIVVGVIGVGVTRALTGGRDGDTPVAGASSTTGVATTPPGHHHTVPPVSLGTSFTPGSGSTVPDKPVRTRRTVPLTSPAPFGTGLVVRIVRITPVPGRATQPGEVSGPALRMQLIAHNSSKHAVSLDDTVVFVSYGRDRTPAEELAANENRFTGRLGPHASISATYVFQVPRGERGDVRVEVSYTGRAPTVAFEGAV